MAWTCRRRRTRCRPAGLALPAQFPCKDCPRFVVFDKSGVPQPDPFPMFQELSDYASGSPIRFMSADQVCRYVYDLIDVRRGITGAVLEGCAGLIYVATVDD